MNNTQKILLAIGVGVGAGYLYHRYMRKGTTLKSSTKSNITPTTMQIPESIVGDMSREEKEEYILDNVFTSSQQEVSGFEGTRFVWNPTIGKMYPVGTIEVGQTPAYVDYVFSSADADNVNSVADSLPNSVETACKILKELNDQEIELLYQVVKKQQENPSIKNEEEALKEMGVTNDNILKVFRKKLKKQLNDLKILKKDANWNAKWTAQKNKRIKRRNDFKERMGFDKSVFEKEVARVCGRKPKVGRKAEYKKCVESVAKSISSKIKSEVREEVSNSPVSVKEQITEERQQSFRNQIVNRRSGGMFAGHRWDGESNNYIENLVDKGIA
jgi:flagellar hook protein FlgE